MSCVRCLLCAAHLILASAACGRMVMYADEPLNIGTRRELFVDHYLIERMQGTSLRLGTPRDEGEAFRFDLPWEGPFCAYVTILHDGENYRAYYRGTPRS